MAAKLITFNKRETSRMVRLYTEKHHSMQELADEFGVSLGVIRRTLIEAGVELRGKGRIAGKAY